MLQTVEEFSFYSGRTYAGDDLARVTYLLVSVSNLVSEHIKEKGGKPSWGDGTAPEKVKQLINMVVTRVFDESNGNIAETSEGPFRVKLKGLNIFFTEDEAKILDGYIVADGVPDPTQPPVDEYPQAISSISVSRPGEGWYIDPSDRSSWYKRW